MKPDCSTGILTTSRTNRQTAGSLPDCRIVGTSSPDSSPNEKKLEDQNPARSAVFDLRDLRLCLIERPADPFMNDQKSSQQELRWRVYFSVLCNFAGEECFSCLTNSGIHLAHFGCHGRSALQTLQELFRTQKQTSKLQNLSQVYFRLVMKILLPEKPTEHSGDACQLRSACDDQYFAFLVAANFANPCA